MFTISDAKQIISELLDEWDINPEQVRITYYEVGLNIPVDHDPIEYISLAESIGVMRNRELFNDANFEKNRQKQRRNQRTSRRFSRFTIKVLRHAIREGYVKVIF